MYNKDVIMVLCYYVFLRVKDLVQDVGKTPWLTMRQLWLTMRFRGRSKIHNNT